MNEIIAWLFLWWLTGFLFAVLTSIYFDKEVKLTVKDCLQCVLIGLLGYVLIILGLFYILINLYDEYGNIVDKYGDTVIWRKQ